MEVITFFKFQDLTNLEETKPPKIENGVLTFKKDEYLEFVNFLGNKELKEVRFECIQSKLRYLNLSYSSIEKISFDFECPNLQSIIIHGSKEETGFLSKFEILVSLPKLKLIDLSNNKNLNEIIISSDLPELSFLYLTMCGLRDLQNFAKFFVRDQFDFIIDKNENLQSPPIEIVQQGKKAVINYYNSIYNGEKIEFDYLFEAKLILVGEERAGKSTIAKALSQENFKIDLNQKSTEGIDVLKWMVPKQEVKTDKDFRFNIWDFGGQEVYHATHQFFLTKRSLYLFVTEARKDLRFDDFYYWLNIINTLAGKSPVILVQNKADQSHNELSIEPYQKAYPQIYDGLQKVSCNTQHEQWNDKYCHTIGSLKSTIYDILRNRILEGIGDKLPISWVEIRKEIAELQRKKLNCIGFADYLKICEEKGLDEEKALSLSDYFHDLGVFLHFRTDMNLRNTIFLNYEWVTKGIYNVLDNAKIKNVTFGQFTDEDLISIWDEPQFKGKEPELLNLMKNEEFKICYQHKKGYYLAPQLFSDKVVAYEWRTNDSNLVFRYNYKFMPKGIISQLIVMLHKYIYEDTFWKYGVLFDHRNTRAIVTENRLENKNIIKIKVDGVWKSDLLRLIGEKIEEINKSYTNLVCDEEFACNCVDCEKSEGKHYFNLKTINNFINKKKKYLTCSNSAEEVEINGLLGYYIPQEQLSAYEKEGTTNITNIFGKKIGVAQGLNNLSAQESKFKFNERINEIRILIANNKEEETIKELMKISILNPDLKNKIILISSRLNQINFEKEHEDISLNETNNEKNKLYRSLLKILDELQRNELITTESKNNFMFSINKPLPYALKQIKIQKFRGINEIQLIDLPVDAKWIFLTGENGYGKTSFLQALVIGLLGKEDETKILVKKEDETLVGLEFLNNNQSQINNIGSPDFTKFFNFAAYGSSRLITQGQVQNYDSEQINHSFNIFHDNGILLDIEDKLKNLERSDKQLDNKLFITIKGVLLKLLPDISDIQIDNNRVYYIEKEKDNNSIFQPLLFKDLASGYKSIIAMVGDMLIRLTSHQPNLVKIENIAGIVIIDEFDLHLHPKWQRQFVELLTSTFQNIQFIVSTHSVIPILGAPENSIFLNVNRTVKEGITIKKVNINVKTLLPNSLLTSPLFDFFDITQKEYDAEKDNLRTENKFNEIFENELIDNRLIEYSKSKNIKLD